MGSEMCIRDSVYSEIIVPGRVAMGELFDYDICYLKSSGRNDDQILFNDSSILEPKNHEITIPSILGNYTILATVYIITHKENTANLEDKINSDFQNNDEVKGGLSVLPNDAGMCIRILGNSCLLYTSPSPRDGLLSRMPSSA